MRVVVVGASSGLGRCIGVGLATRGEQVALLARRAERLRSAAAEAGDGATVVACDVTDESSVQHAVEQAAEALGGIDAVVYTPGVGPLARIEDTDAATWRATLDTNVVGASIVTAAALPHLAASKGRILFLSSINGSTISPLPGLGAYAVSKAALNTMVDAWTSEHPEIGFTRCIIGDCTGGDGEAATGFADGWDWDLAAEIMPAWSARGAATGWVMDADHLVEAVHGVLRLGATVAVPSIVITPRVGGRNIFVAEPESPTGDAVAAGS